VATPVGAEHPSGRVFVRSRWVWLAWYPLRYQRAQCDYERADDGWVLSLGLGPMYLGLGPGTPLP
jgi:hypothetical protein